MNKDKVKEIKTHGIENAKSAAKVAREAFADTKDTAKELGSKMTTVDACVATAAALAVIASIWKADLLVLPVICIGFAMCYAVVKMTLIESKKDGVHLRIRRVRGSANLDFSGSFSPIDESEDCWDNWKTPEWQEE